MKDFEKQIAYWSGMVQEADIIDPELYKKYEVKKGLRDISGKGVLAGLTRIGEIHSYIIDEGETIPQPGRLIYRGMDINSLVNGFLDSGRSGYEETAYLLLMGELPNQEELDLFTEIISRNRKLPDNFVRDVVMGIPTTDLMNVMARSVLSLYSYDHNPDDTGIENVLRQSLKLIATMPLIAVYGYQSLKYYKGESSLVLHSPVNELGIAENILYMLRHDNKYTKLEAQLLDLALVLHAEHGGGNNSSFTTHVITSSGTDTYSTIAAAIGALKGPKHGGANIKVTEMFKHIKENIKDWKDEAAIEEYLIKILNKEAFDKQGLIYGVGHAVYSVSDPRAVIFKNHVKQLAYEKGYGEEFELYDKVEKLAPKVITAARKMYKGVSVNVDFYSGFVYSMLGIPEELYTPLFAISRVTGWCSHRLEEIVNKGKIIRPAYRSVARRREYEKIENRV